MTKSAQLDADISAALTKRGRGRKAVSATEALRASEAALRATDDALLAPEQQIAAEAHLRAARLHKSDPAGAEAAWLHDLAASNHRQCAKARKSMPRKVPGPLNARWNAYQEKLSAALDHGHMAKEYARRAVTAARERT
jgi:hypothetical protein